ncbi:hypothetical protein [Aliamphritea hakodatensis]|uniref:hypothetical protein n=1 Tax=Aliamphritea hakodatensis TaxID=2895352 RepID=UPI0022FD5A2C|nr:hypothetical protein [Aliamphritea hakodatensis]
MSAYIIAAAKTTDGQPAGGSHTLSDCQTVQARLSAAGISIHHLTIDPLSTDWHSPLEPGHFRSGAAPVEALTEALSLLQTPGTAVVISGTDPLRTGYEKTDRTARMAIYGTDYTLIDAYTDLSKAFAHQHSFSETQFRQCAQALFDNYLHTFAERHPDAPQPGAAWFKPVSELFRGVDCANPVQDFSGQLILCHADTADTLAIPQAQRVAVRGASCITLPADGKPAIAEIVRYGHLHSTFQQACQQASIDFRDAFVHGHAILDVYTCFPVVPMAFLLTTGFVSSPDALPHFLAEYPVTVSGGMNLAKGPWNNPALSSLIDSYRVITEGRSQIAGVHGNGGLGYKQGFAILTHADYPA